MLDIYDLRLVRPRTFIKQENLDILNLNKSRSFGLWKARIGPKISLVIL